MLLVYIASCYVRNGQEPLVAMASKLASKGFSEELLYMSFLVGFTAKG